METSNRRTTKHSGRSSCSRYSSRSIPIWVVGGLLSPSAATAARKAIVSHTPGTEVELPY